MLFEPNHRGRHRKVEIPLIMEDIDRKKRRGFVLVLAGIAAGAAAQGMLLFWLGRMAETTYRTAGLVLYTLAGLLFILGLRRLGDSLAPFAANTSGPVPQKRGLVFWLAGLGLAIMIAAYAGRATRQDDYGHLFAEAWVFSILLIVLGVFEEEGWRPPSLQATKDWLRAHRAELLVVGTVLAAAFLIRFVDADWHPYSFNNDEGHMGTEALCIINNVCTNFFNLGWASQPQLAFFPYAISIGLLGNTALAVRMVSILTGALAVLALYLLAREIFSKKVAWVSALLLSSLPLHVHFSRVGVDNIADSLTTTLVLWLLFWSVKRASRLGFLAAGIFAGLCIYTYPGSLLAPFFGVLALGLLALRTPGFLRANAGNIATFVLATFIVALPILGYYAAHSETFLARFKKEGIFQNGTLDREIRATGRNVAEIAEYQFLQSTLVFIATDAPHGFFNSPKAYLPPVAAMFAIFGLAYVLWRIKDPRCALILAWFFGVVILGSALTSAPPTSQRILMSTPPLVIMVGLGMLKIFEAFTRFSRPFARFAPLVVLVILLYIGHTNIDFYFQHYRVWHYYENPKDELTYEVRFYTASTPPPDVMYLIADPNVPYLLYASFDYFAPDLKKFSLNDPTPATLLGLPDDKDILFVALPDYESDLKRIAQTIPGGEWHETKRRYQPRETLFYTYKVGKEQVALFSGFLDEFDP